MEKPRRNSHPGNMEVSPAGSKFREVFNDMSIFSARRSLLSELNLVLPHDIILAQDDGAPSATFDGNASDPASSSPLVGQNFTKHSVQGHLKVPSADQGRERPITRGKTVRIQSTKFDGSSRPRGFSSSREGDETAELWKRAARAESVTRSHRRSTSSQLPVPQQPKVQDDGQVPKAPQPSETGSHSGSGSHNHSPTCTEPIEKDDEGSFRRALMRSNTVLEEWANQLQFQERQAKRKSRPFPSGFRSFSAESKMPPASWSRFPSYNRKERNAQAGEADNVKQKDFAIKKVSDTGTITWITDKDEIDTAVQRSMVRSLSDKFAQPFKSRWSRLVAGRLAIPAKDKSSLGERRSSIQISGDLEYPELELLPTAGGFRELQALEREINEIRGFADPKMRISSDGAENPQIADDGYIEQMTSALQHDGGTDVQEANEGNIILANTQSPSTPETQVRYLDPALSKDLTDSSGDRYATPLSHMSQKEGLSRLATPEMKHQLPALAHGSSPFQVEMPSGGTARLSLHERNVTGYCSPCGLWGEASNSRRRSDPVSSSTGRM